MKTDPNSNGNGQLDDIQKSVLSRLRRIEGQIRGIQRMVENGKECEDILVQVKAATSALKSTNSLVLKRYLLKCKEKAGDTQLNEKVYAELEKTVKMLSSFIDS